MEIRDIPPAPQAPRMVECRGCGRRYAGIDLVGRTCPECGERLDCVPGPNQERIPNEPAVEVYRAPNQIQADMIREHLEASGLRVAFHSGFPAQIFPFTIDGLSEVALLVLESDASRARALIDAFLNDTVPDLPPGPPDENEEEPT